MQIFSVILLSLAALGTVIYASVLVLAASRKRVDDRLLDRVSLSVFCAALVVGIGSAMIGTGFATERYDEALAIGGAFGTTASGLVAWLRAADFSRVAILISAGCLAAVTAYGSAGLA